MQNAKKQGRGSSMNAESIMQNARVLDLLRDSASWRLLGRLFECPDDHWRRDIAALAAEVDDDGLRAAADAALATASEGQYHSVFGPGGPAPPREVSYHDSLELGSLMSELAGCYEAFGYRPATSEAPDHIAVETAFIAYLRFKEAYARAAGDEEHAMTTATAAARYLANHLATLAVPLAAVLADSEIDYLVRASGLLAARVGDPPARTRLRVIQNDPDHDNLDGSVCCDG
jgi:nitrate reductase assembly molybdenum cofactor insertion protein NarJ